MSVITAKNEQGITRTFTQMQWNLLGKNKGWVEIEAQKVYNNEPSTGDKKEVTNEVTNDIQPPTETTVVVDEQKKDLFVKAGHGISKGALKDYCDTNSIEYQNNYKINELLLAIGAACNYDIAVLQSNF